MDIELKREYERIGRERSAAEREFARERRRFMVVTVIWCWVWCIAGLALIGQSFRVHAQIGWIEFPRQMLLAKSYFWAGQLVGTGGAFGTLVYRWRNRGMLD